MCILLCFMEYNEKSRLGTTYLDELFKNAVAAVYKAAAAAAAQPLFFLSSYIPLFIIIIFIIMCVRRTWIYIVVVYREHVWCGEENGFCPHKEVGTPYT